MSNFLKVGEGLSFLKLDTAPSSPVEGMVYYDDTLNALRYYDGTQWIDIGETSTLQEAYDVSSSGDLTLSSSVGPLRIKDNATPLVGDLFKVTNNGASVDYFSVDANGVYVPVLTAKTSLKIEDPGAGTNTVTIQAPTLAGSYTLTLPVNDGASGEVLSTNGSGVLSWTAGGGANQQLSNLSSTAVNDSIIPDADAVHNLGSITNNWSSVYTNQVFSSGILESVGATGVDVTSLAGDVTITPFGDLVIDGPTRLTTSGIDANSNSITNLPLPSLATDAVRRTHVDNVTSRNYVEGTADLDIVGWTTYSDAAASIPVDGTGGTPAVTITRTTISPLSREASLLLTKPASNEQGEGASYAFSIDRADQAKVLTISFDYEIAAGTFNYNDGTSANPSDIAIYVYDVSNSTLIYPTQSFLDGSKRFVSQFQSSSTSTSYRLIFHVATTNAANWGFEFDNVKVGPSITATGAVMSDWIAYTPTGSWVTATSYSGKYRRVGDSLEVMANVSTSGLPTATALTVSLPSGLSIDTSKLESPLIYQNPLGSAQLWDNSTSFAHNAQVTYATTTSVAVIYQSQLTGQQSTVTQAAPFTFAASDEVNISFSVPIQGWSTNVAISSDYGNRVIAMNANNVAGTTILTTITDIPFTVLRQTTSSYSGSTFTVPETGWYQINASLTSATATFTTAQSIQAFATVDGATTIRGTKPYGTGASGILSSVVSGSLYLTAGQAVKIQGLATSTAIALRTDVDANTMSIYKIQSPQTLASGEVVAFRGYNTAGTSITSAGVTVPLTVERDTHSAFSGSTYTVPVSGWYNLSGRLQISGLNLTTAQTFNCLFTINSVDYEGQYSNGTGVSRTHVSTNNQSIYLVAGSTISLKGNSSVTGNLTNANDRLNIMSITKVG